VTFDWPEWVDVSEVGSAYEVQMSISKIGAYRHRRIVHFARVRKLGDPIERPVLPWNEGIPNEVES